MGSAHHYFTLYTEETLALRGQHRAIWTVEHHRRGCAETRASQSRVKNVAGVCEYSRYGIMYTRDNER
jgi:hypothetical protein